ncbi:MAG: FtsH protease activity modulator HflK [Rhodospirillales bacterium]|nr:FtsH protease activity modulator HflK [Rhodospirillales bacterium]
MASDVSRGGPQSRPEPLASGGPGSNPWGPRPGGGSGGGSGGGPQRPEGPWGPGPGADLDALIASVRRFFASRRPSGGGGGRGPGGGGGWRWRGRGFGGARGVLLLVVVVVGAWLATGFYVVQPDEQGVVLRFGAFAGTTSSGLNYHLPWPIETVLLPPVTRIERVEIGYRTAPGSDGAAPRDVPAESLMLTGDENIIDLHFTVFWRIRDAKAFLFNTRHPAQTVKAVAESVMREVIGSTPIQPALTDARTRIQLAVQKGVQTILDHYGTGIEVTQVTLQKSDPPAQVIESFRDVQRAAADAQRTINVAEAYRNDIVPRARGTAAQIVAAAEANKAATEARARGESQRFLSVLAAYDVAKSITLQRLYIETMQAILSSTPTTVVDGAVRGLLPMLPLGGPPPQPSPAPTPAAKGVTP